MRLNTYVGAMVLVISFHVDVQNQCNALILAIFIIDWPTIWIRITWVNRIHFISISCVFDVFRSFCKILHNLQTKSNAVAFNWSGVFCSNVGKSVVLIWIFADRCRQWMGQYRFFLSFEWNADITHYILKSNILLFFFILFIRQGRSSNSLPIDAATIWLVIGFNGCFRLIVFIFIHIFIELIFNAENFLKYEKWCCFCAA